MGTNFAFFNIICSTTAFFYFKRIIIEVEVDPIRLAETWNAIVFFGSVASANYCYAVSYEQHVIIWELKSVDSQLRSCRNCKWLNIRLAKTTSTLCAYLRKGKQISSTLYFLLKYTSFAPNYDISTAIISSSYIYILIMRTNCTVV